MEFAAVAAESDSDGAEALSDALDAERDDTDTIRNLRSILESQFHLQLTDQQTSVLVRAYKEGGQDALHHMLNMFHRVREDVYERELDRGRASVEVDRETSHAGAEAAALAAAVKLQRERERTSDLFERIQGMQESYQSQIELQARETEALRRQLEQKNRELQETYSELEKLQETMPVGRSNSSGFVLDSPYNAAQGNGDQVAGLRDEVVRKEEEIGQLQRDNEAMQSKLEELQSVAYSVEKYRRIADDFESELSSSMSENAGLRRRIEELENQLISAHFDVTINSAVPASRLTSERDSLARPFTARSMDLRSPQQSAVLGSALFDEVMEENRKLTQQLVEVKRQLEESRRLSAIGSPPRSAASSDASRVQAAGLFGPPSSSSDALSVGTPRSLDGVRSWSETMPRNVATSGARRGGGLCASARKSPVDELPPHASHPPRADMNCVVAIETCSPAELLCDVVVAGVTRDQPAHKMVSTEQSPTRTLLEINLPRAKSVDTLSLCLSHALREVHLRGMRSVVVDCETFGPAIGLHPQVSAEACGQAVRAFFDELVTTRESLPHRVCLCIAAVHRNVFERTMLSYFPPAGAGGSCALI